jgi:hypothetical protein
MIGNDRNYRMIRVVCKGNIKTCDRCSSSEFNEGYCPQCGRPLWKKSEESCNCILGYVEKEIKIRGKINFVCRNCSTVTTY